MTLHAHQLLPADVTAVPLILRDCDASFGRQRGSPWCVLQVLDPRSIFNPQTCGWIQSKLLLSGTEISAGTLLPKAEDSDYLASLCQQSPRQSHNRAPPWERAAKAPVSPLQSWKASNRNTSDLYAKDTHQ